MELIADVLLVLGALGVAFYCFVLSRRLSRFTDLERGVGGAVAVLSGQVDDLTRALNGASGAADAQAELLRDLTARADGVARQLEIQIAALHDLPEEPQPGGFRSATHHGAERDAPRSEDRDPGAASASGAERPEHAGPPPEEKAAPARKGAMPVRSFFATHRASEGAPS